MACNLAELLENSVSQYSDKVALRYKKEDKWNEISYAELGKKVDAISSFLLNKGFEKGDKIAILSENRPEWAISYLAATTAGMTAVPIITECKEKEIRYILQDSESKLIFCSESQSNKLEGISLEKVLLENFPEMYNEKSQHLEKARKNIYEDDLAMLMYTSGTTGSSKGIMLTHDNLVFNVEASSKTIDFDSRDNFFSILPLAHIFECVAGFLVPESKGASISYNTRLAPTEMLQNLKEVKPTIILAVPLIFRKFYEKINNKINSDRIARNISKIPVLNKAIAWKVKKEAFPKLRFMISGGAALNKEIVKNYQKLGIKILQGYGLTESSPMVSVNTPEGNKLGSSGKPIPGVEIKIDGEHEGEILVRGRNVMKGYYKNEEKTKEVIEDGWLHTGDLGYIDDEGFLYICGRSKNVIVLEGGKNVYPEEIEDILNKNPRILESVVYAHKGKEGEEVGALVIPNYEVVSGTKEEIYNELKEEVEKICSTVADFKKIKKFAIYRGEFPKNSLGKIIRHKIDLNNTISF